MSTALIRLKPDPIPPIHPLPEYRAEGARAKTYADTKAVLQVPWMGVVTMAFSHYPAFWNTLWSGLRPLAQSHEWVEACGALRSAAEEAADGLGPSPRAEALADLGYAPREIDEIRALIEVFSHGNMPYLLIATAARLLLEGHALAVETEVTPFAGRHGPAADRPLTLIEPHHADAPTVALYGDIRRRLGLPFVNTDYRALARWPTAFAALWGGLRGTIPRPAYEAAVASVHGKAVVLARALPNPGGLTPEALAQAAARDGDRAEILSVVRLFQWLLPGLATNVAHFRAALAPAPLTPQDRRE